MAYAMLVGGDRLAAEGGRTLPAWNPYTGEQIDTIPDATAADVDQAVQAARRAFDAAWRQTPGGDRARYMHRLADLIDEHADDLGRLETLDNGKLLKETAAQARFAAKNYRFFAGYADKLYGRTVPAGQPRTCSTTRCASRSASPRW